MKHNNSTNKPWLMIPRFIFLVLSYTAFNNTLFIFQVLEKMKLELKMVKIRVFAYKMESFNYSVSGY